VAGAGQVPLRELMDDRLLDARLERSRDAAGGPRLTGEGSMLGELVAAVLERALAAELTAHLGYERNERADAGLGNYRNGTIDKTVQTGVGPVPLRVPRDRNAAFEPVLVPKRSGRVAGGLDDMIISLYAIMVKVRDNQVVQSKLAYLAVGIDADGEKHVLGIWLARTAPETATAGEGTPREARARPSDDLVIPGMPAVPTGGGGERPVP
jgi:transposase-like protein